MKADEVRAVLIAGPTASGKSAAAVALCERLGGMVINADSMQVYDAIPILSAQPGADERRDVPHRLFGFVPANQAYSVARWLEDAGTALGEAEATGLLPVFTGGTGLYFKALGEGISPVPETDPAIRKALRDMAENDPDSLMARLRAADPQAAAQIGPGDMQRAARALEVLESTGRTLAWWQARDGGTPLLQESETMRCLILPGRIETAERIRDRFRQMVAEGALDEVAALLSRGIGDDLPAMRAIGMRELAAHLRGQSGLEEAIERAVAATRQYAKRQRTWFRNQFDESWRRFETPHALLNDREVAELARFRRR